MLILHALGGQGKSQIALEYCQSSRERYSGIFWVNASTEALAVQSYTGIAKTLGFAALAGTRDDDETIRSVVDFLEGWNKSWLLVFDNYDDPDTFSEVRNFLPQSEFCSFSWDIVQ